MIDLRRLRWAYWRVRMSTMYMERCDPPLLFYQIRKAAQEYDEAQAQKGNLSQLPVSPPAP